MDIQGALHPDFIRRLFRSKPVRQGMLLVVLFGGALGYFFWNSVTDPIPHLYVPSLQSADWIRLADGAPQGYYRKEIFVSQPVREAWVTVAATDAYQIYLNGESVSHGTFISTNVSGVHDISRKVVTGKNVIAVSIHRQSYPGPSRLALRLVLRDYSGRERVTVTDGSWKAAPLEERQNSGMIMWYAPEFNASQWPSADDAGPVREREIDSISFDPQSIGAPARARWILHPDPVLKSAYFEKNVSIPSPVREAWIRISATEHYDLLINGAVVAERDVSQTGMDVYDITPLVRSGVNRIAIGTTGRLGPPRVFAEGMIRTRNGEARLFQTDSSWTAVRFGDSKTVPARGETSRSGAVAAVADLSLPSGPFEKTIQSVTIPIDGSWRAYGRLLLLIALGILFSVTAWLGYARFLQGRFHAEWENALRSAAFLYLPALLFLSFLLLLRFDISHDPSFPFQIRFIVLAVFLLLVFKTFFWIERRRRERMESGGAIPPAGVWRRFETFQSRGGSWVWAIAVSALLLTGLALRLHGLGEPSLTHDEVGLIQYVQDFQTQGYPSKKIGSLDKPLTTYELIPYPIAFSVTLFGWSDWSARLPAAFFGGLTILLIYWTGRDLFNPWVGLLSAAIYTFSPWAMIWSQNLFYPQQAQFASLLTLYLFFKAIRDEAIVPRYLYLAAASFLFNYLSWEGTGFLLPALAVGLVAYKGDDFSWLKSRPVWWAIGGVGLAIFIQYCLRILTQVPYLAVGTGTGDIKFDPLFFLNAMYDPYFYLEHFFWLEGHEVLTVFFILGGFLIVRSRTLRFLYAVLLSVVLAMTDFLPVYAQRYLYYAQPFLILSAAAVCVTMLQSLFDRRPAESGPNFLQDSLWSVSRCAASARAVVVLLLPLLIFFSSNSGIFKLYRFSENSTEPPPQTRLGVYYIDYRSANEYLGKSFREGDAVVAVMTHMVHYYAGLDSDFNFNSTLASRSYYDPEARPPHYLDRYMGNPVMRDFEEARNVLLGHPRVWIIAAPSDGFISQNERDLVQYLLNNSKVMYESYKAKVYLWKG
jgi:hypothetical protein